MTRAFLPLLYHDISTGIKGIDRHETEHLPYIMTKEVFSEHLNILKAHGFAAVTSEEIMKPVNSNPEKLTVITFDDGHLSNYTAAIPLLEQFGYRGIFFITTSFIGRENMLSWQQLREMIKLGMEIGSHTVNHHIPHLLSTNALLKELIESRHALEDRLGSPVRSISSPTGFHDYRMRELAAEAGYKLLFVGVTRIFQQPLGKIDLLWINRMDMKKSISIKEFSGLVKGKKIPTFRIRFREYLLGHIKTLMGHDKYNAVRKLMLSYQSKS